MKHLTHIFNLLLFPFLILKSWISTIQTMKSTLSISFSTLALFFLLTGSVQANTCDTYSDETTCDANYCDWYHITAADYECRDFSSCDDIANENTCTNVDAIDCQWKSTNPGSGCNAVPVSDAGADQTVALGDTVNLSGSGSSDADSDTLTYAWVMTSRPAGSSATLSDATIINPTFTADKIGSYVITLVVNDGTGNSNLDSITVYASLDFLPDLYIYCSPLSTFENGSIDLGGSIIVIGTNDGNVTTPSLSGAGTCKDINISVGVTCGTDGDFVEPIATIPTDDGTSSDSEQEICNISNVDQEYGPIKCTSANSTYDNAIIRINGTLDLSASGYTLTIKNNVEIHTSGEIKLMVDQIIFETGATLTIYTDGKVTFGSNIFTAPSSMPPNNFKIYATGEIITGSDSTINALLYSSSTITLGSDSTLNGSVTAHDINGGSNSTVDATTIENCGGSGISYDVPFFVDAVDTAYSDATYTDPETGPDIKTKVSAAQTGYNFDAVYLGTDNTGVETYTSSHGLNLTVQVTLTNSTCSEEYYWDDTVAGTEPVGVAEIIPGSSFASLNETVQMPAIVGKDMRLLLKAVDWNILWDTFNIGNACNGSNTSGNLCGVMSCLGSLTQAEEAFPINTDDSDVNSNSRRIMVDCYGVTINYNGDGDIDDTLDGSTAASYSPCNTSNYKGSCGGLNDNADIEPDEYEHKYGCLSCILDTDLDGVGCSVDHFAIRPDRFVIDIPTGNDYPNLLRAGVDYNVSLTALDDVGAVSSDFNVTDHNWAEDLDANSSIKYFKNDTVDTTDLLKGTASISTSATPIYSVSGKSSRSDISIGVAEEVVPVSYNDVGKINLVVYDKNWASIDNDDTPTDCNSTEHTYICADVNVTFIPHHFGFAELNITNHAGPDNNFTYVADNRGMPITPPTRSPMAARIQTQIYALTEDGNITQNFKAEDALYPYAEVDETTRLYYEHPVNVSFIVTVPSTGTNSYLYPDANESNTTTTSDPNLYNYIGFGRTGVDVNGSGTRDLLWNESNFPLEFNFRREINEPANPFDVNGSHLKSITIISHYIDPDDSTKTADINGSRVNGKDVTCATGDDGCIEDNADNNATFYYGRARSSKYYYKDITEDSVLTPITINVYCDPLIVNCTDYGIDTALGTIDQINWYLSTDHNANRGDGNITIKVGATLIEPPGISSNDQEIDSSTHTNVMIISAGIKNDVNVSRGSTPLPPLTVPLEFVVDGDLLLATPPYTNQWLIYNEFDSILIPDPFYKVRFIGDANWTGEGKTGYVIDIEASYQKTQRSEW